MNDYDFDQERKQLMDYNPIDREEIKKVIKIGKRVG